MYIIANQLTEDINCAYMYNDKMMMIIIIHCHITYTRLTSAATTFS